MLNESKRLMITVSKYFGENSGVSLRNYSDDPCTSREGFRYQLRAGNSNLSRGRPTRISHEVRLACGAFLQVDSSRSVRPAATDARNTRMTSPWSGISIRNGSSVGGSHLVGALRVFKSRLASVGTRAELRSGPLTRLGVAPRNSRQSTASKELAQN